MIMANIQENREKLNKAIKQGIYTLQNDPEAMTRFRTLVLAFFVCFAFIYGAYSTYVEPLNTKYNKKKVALSSLDLAAPIEANDMLAMAYKKLKEQDIELDEQLNLLKFQEKMYRDQWQFLSDEQKFARIILTTMPSPPPDLQEGLGVLRKLDAIEKEGYSIHPNSIEGEASYQSLINYLYFLESRVEIGSLDKISVQNRYSDHLATEDTVLYGIRIGRILLEESL